MTQAFGTPDSCCRDPHRRRPDHAEAVSDRGDLLRRVDALPDRQRIAVVLRYFADLDDAEIATALGCERVSVRSYISRGLSTLRIDLAPDSPSGARRPAGKDI